jgi:catechol 1,2-dioxygenase
VPQTTMSPQPQTGAPAPSHKYDQNFTQNVIDTCGPNTSPRFLEIYASAVRHLHDFTREVNLTPEEWLEGVTFFNQVGKTWAESNGKRNEMHRMCDLVGLES